MTEITTAPELFDLCQELFGIGGYDENAAAETPYYKVRMIEIAKIKAMVKKRGLDYKTLGATALYCSRQGLRIDTVGGLIKHIGPALVERRRLEALEKYRQIELRRSELIELALNKEDWDLARQLLRVELRVGMTDAVFSFAVERLGLS